MCIPYTCIYGHTCFVQRLDHIAILVYFQSPLSRKVWSARSGMICRWFLSRQFCCRLWILIFFEKVLLDLFIASIPFHLESSICLTPFESNCGIGTHRVVQCLSWLYGCKSLFTMILWLWNCCWSNRMHKSHTHLPKGTKQVKVLWLQQSFHLVSHKSSRSNRSVCFEFTRFWTPKNPFKKKTAIWEFETLSKTLRHNSLVVVGVCFSSAFLVRFLRDGNDQILVFHDGHLPGSVMWDLTCAPVWYWPSFIIRCHLQQDLTQSGVNFAKCAARLVWRKHMFQLPWDITHPQCQWFWRCVHSLIVDDQDPL